MKSNEAEVGGHLLESQILIDIFKLPGVVKKAKEFKKKFSSRREGSALILEQAKKLLDNAGRREDGRDSGFDDPLPFNDYFRTDSIRLVVDGEPVYLSLHAKLDKTEFDVLANIINRDKKALPILFSASLANGKIKVENGNMKKLENNELASALGILSIMNEVLPYDRPRPANPQK